MKQLLIIGLVLGLASCSVNKNKLSNDPTIKEVFTESEIQDLQLLLEFFNQTIYEPGKDIEVCFNDFFAKVKQSFDSGSVYLHIPFEKQQEVYEKFQDSTFYQIWTFNETWKPDHPNDTFQVVDYKWDGKFMKFLKIAGEKDFFIKSYHELVAVAGGISPGLTSYLIMNEGKANIDNVKVKFVIAVNYLTLNDQYKRRELVSSIGE